MIFNDSSDRACSFSIGECLRDSGFSVSITHSDLPHEMSHLVVTDRDRLPGAEPRRQLEPVAHALGRILDQQMALVVVAHLEHIRGRLLAFHVSLAQLLIDNNLHMTISPWPLIHPAKESYKRTLFPTRTASVKPLSAFGPPSLEGRG